jgi:hypothetical protein
MGGGPSCRVVFLEYIERMTKMLEMGDYRKIMKRHWFALRNFHCHYFEDSWVLNEYIHNWGESLEDHYEQVLKNRSFTLRIGAFLNRIPGMQSIVQRVAYNRMKKMVYGNDGTVFWYKNKNDKRISAFYGSYGKYELIGGWEDSDMPNLRPEWKRLDHGYDESKTHLALEDLQSAAGFRGGELLSSLWEGDMHEKLKWRCAFNHEFDGTPYLILKAGHWCPECAAPPWNYDEIAKRNPFFAQVWYPNHDTDENNFYLSNCYKDIL